MEYHCFFKVYTYSRDLLVFHTYLAETTQTVLFSAHSQMKVQKVHLQENVYSDTETEETGQHLLRE